MVHCYIIESMLSNSAKQKENQFTAIDSMEIFSHFFQSLRLFVLSKSADTLVDIHPAVLSQWKSEVSKLK